MICTFIRRDDELKVGFAVGGDMECDGDVGVGKDESSNLFVVAPFSGRRVEELQIITALTSLVVERDVLYSDHQTVEFVARRRNGDLACLVRKLVVAASRVQDNSRVGVVDVGSY